jgi:C4-type Zn-finger protein
MKFNDYNNNGKLVLSGNKNQNQIYSTNIECPVCNNALNIDLSKEYLCNPPRYNISCPCGFKSTIIKKQE